MADTHVTIVGNLVEDPEVRFSGGAAPRRGLFRILLLCQERPTTQRPSPPARSMLPDGRPSRRSWSNALPRAGDLARIVAGAEWPRLSGGGLRRPPASTGRGHQYGRLASRWVIPTDA
jgi:hypothetical protein